MNFGNAHLRKNPQVRAPDPILLCTAMLSKLLQAGWHAAREALVHISREPSLKHALLVFGWPLCMTDVY